MQLYLLLHPVLQNSTPDWTQMASVLAWLAGPVGAVMAINWLVANFLEKVAWWGKLPRWFKWTAPPTFAIVLAIGVQQIIKIPGLSEIVGPYWGLVVSIIMGYFASQKGYIETKRLRALTDTPKTKDLG